MWIFSSLQKSIKYWEHISTYQFFDAAVKNILTTNKNIPEMFMFCINMWLGSNNL